MAIIRATVDDSLYEFGEDPGLADVWVFIDLHMASSDAERAIHSADGCQRSNDK